MAIATIHDLLVHELTNVRDAEEQAAEALSVQVDEIDDEDIEELLEARLETGERLKHAAQSALDKLGGAMQGGGDDAARGIITAVQTTFRASTTRELRMAILIAGVQKFDHYCLATWAAVKALASEAGEPEIVAAMQRAIDASCDLDDQLTEIAERGAHAGAAAAQGEKKDPQTRQS